MPACASESDAAAKLDPFGTMTRTAAPCGRPQAARVRRSATETTSCHLIPAPACPAIAGGASPPPARPRRPFARESIRPCLAPRAVQRQCYTARRRTEQEGLYVSPARCQRLGLRESTRSRRHFHPAAAPLRIPSLSVTLRAERSPLPAGAFPRDGR